MVCPFFQIRPVWFVISDGHQSLFCWLNLAMGWFFSTLFSGPRNRPDMSDMPKCLLLNRAALVWLVVTGTWLVFFHIFQSSSSQLVVWNMFHLSTYCEESSQLTNSYVSERFFVNHQPVFVMRCGRHWQPPFAGCAMPLTPSTQRWVLPFLKICRCWEFLQHMAGLLVG